MVYSVGAGTSNTDRRTVLWVSSSYSTFINPGGAGNRGITQISGDRGRLFDGVTNGSGSTAAEGIYTFATDAVTSTGAQGKVGVIIASTNSTLQSPLYSAIIADRTGVQLSNTTSSVALGRDTAYSSTANFTLFTQNINASGSILHQSSYAVIAASGSTNLAGSNQSSSSVQIASLNGQILGGHGNTIISARNSSLRASSSLSAIIASEAAETDNSSAILRSVMMATSASQLFTATNCAIIGGSGVTITTGSNVVALGRDTAYSVSGSNTLYTQNINASGSVSITGSLAVTGDVKFASGSNTTMGTFVLNGGNPGTATVSNSLVSATSLIFLTKQTNTNSGNGTVSITSKGTGTFNVTSDHNGDSDTVAYLIINPS